MQDKIYLIFESIHHVMAVETFLKENSIEFELVPIPTSFTSACGISILISEEHFNNIQNFPKKNKYTIYKEKHG